MIIIIYYLFYFFIMEEGFVISPFDVSLVVTLGCQRAWIFNEGIRRMRGGPDYCAQEIAPSSRNSLSGSEMA